jgi:hypothetical protein
MWESITNGVADSQVPNEPGFQMNVHCQGHSHQFECGYSLQNNLVIPNAGMQMVASGSDITLLQYLFQPAYYLTTLAVYTDGSGNRSFIPLDWTVEPSGIYLTNLSGADLTIQAGTYIQFIFTTIIEMWNIPQPTPPDDSGE